MTLRFLIASPALLIFAQTAPAQSADPSIPDIGALIATPHSEMEPVIRRFEADRGALSRAYRASESAPSLDRIQRFYEHWRDELTHAPFASMSLLGKVDYVLLRNEIGKELSERAQRNARRAEVAAIIPFANRIYELSDSRRLFTTPDGAASADNLTQLAKEIKAAREAIDKRLNAKPEAKMDVKPDVKADAKAQAGAAAETPLPPDQAKRAVELLDSLRNQLHEWYHFSSDYDPAFTWWAAQPFGQVDAAMTSFAAALREKGMHITPDNPNPLVGVPIGHDALVEALKYEMIPYTPEELLAIGEREFKWCEGQLKKTAAEMGFGEDWKAALESIKNEHVQPGEQPKLIHELAVEAVDYLKAKDLITVPPLAEETWRMEMMSPERQLAAPFFTGGEVISVSFPVSSMTQEQKLMSMRGNNKYFSHATVFHELIPGHHLQQFMDARVMPQHRPFSTPFWTEGWALYWEMRLWDEGFQTTPKQRLGALFWRTHRCVRIVFSIKFHLGELTPQQCVDMLVDRVGHERANAEGEVRRSITGDYGPLYQLAYMTGGLQFRALRRELVESGKMTDRQYHDAVMQQGNIPIEMVRALLTNTPPAADFVTNWRFD